MGQGRSRSSSRSDMNCSSSTLRVYKRTSQRVRLIAFHRTSRSVKLGMKRVTCLGSAGSLQSPPSKVDRPPTPLTEESPMIKMPFLSGLFFFNPHTSLVPTYQLTIASSLPSDVARIAPICRTFAPESTGAVVCITGALPCGDDLSIPQREPLASRGG